MPPPTPLQIATQSVQRLVKEEKSYHEELSQQQERVEKLEKDLKSGASSADENAEYVLKQEVSNLQLYHFHDLVSLFFYTLCLKNIWCGICAILYSHMQDSFMYGSL
jgi:hypothetical protein